jgi:hypothetical protein
VGEGEGDVVLPTQWGGGAKRRRGLTGKVLNPYRRWNRWRMPCRRTLISRQMRRWLNHTEVRIWACLRGRRLDGWKFRRQHPIGPYFVDFCCPAARLVVEVFGPAHDDYVQWAYDQRRVRAQDIDLDMEG